MLSGLVSNSTATYLAVLVFGAVFYVIHHARNTHLPPGPKRRWIIGNLLDIPHKVDCEVLASWKRKYGISQLLTRFETLINGLLIDTRFSHIMSQMMLCSCAHLVTRFSC